jgi:nucleolar protein 14
MEREQEDNIRHQLDQEFDSIRSLIYAPDPSSSGSNSIPLGPSRTAEASQETTAIPTVGSNAEDYDQHVRELAFEKRAKPTDRTKTEEEIALEEKEALEKAERRRKRRMLGEDDGDSDVEDGGRGKGKRRREAGGDDLEDDFDGGTAEWDGIGVGLGEASRAGSEGDDDVPEETDHSYDSEESDQTERDGEIGDHEELVATEKPRKGEPNSQIIKELPFTFPCPGSHGEFLEIVESVRDEDIPTVIQRIRALHHPSFGPDNKVKLQVSCRFPWTNSTVNLHLLCRY